MPVQEARNLARQAEQRRQRQLQELRRSISEAPLDPNLVAHFAERNRLATRGLQEAQVHARLARDRANLDFKQFVRQLEQQVDQNITDLRGEGARRNMAFQPIFTGTGMRDIRDRATESQGMAQQDRAQFLAGIDRQIDFARRSRDEEHAAVSRDQARARADHRRMINTQLSGLR